MNILDGIGNTPLVRIPAPGLEPRIRIFAKLEWLNPGGSIKDRVALNVITKGFASGELTKEKTVLEATTGNMGVSLGMVCRTMGLGLELVMPDDTSDQFRRLVEGFGAKITFSPAEKGIDEALRTAYDIFDKAPDRYFLANQFNNGANPQAHYETTGLEIVRQVDGRITHFVAGMGTTGTLMGVGRRLREHFPDVEIIGVEPEKNHRLQGLRNFYDIILPGIYDWGKVQKMLRVTDSQAAQALKVLHKENGIPAGPSSGAAFHGALETAREAPPDSTIVTVFPDSRDRYLATELCR